MNLLKVENLSKIYGTGEHEVRAIDKVSFEVEKGEFVSIIGPSGSGKSTLLHILGGVDKPTDGTVTIEGTDLYALNETELAVFRRRQAGLVYQFYNLIPILDVKENMTLPLLLDGQQIDDSYLMEILHTLHLEDRISHLPSQLSGGQQQRAAIGRALINHPAIVLADEPTGNLDRKNSQEVITLLKEFNRKYGQTLIIITHDESIALQSDRILYLEDGRIVKDDRIRSRQTHDLPENGVY